MAETLIEIIKAIATLIGSAIIPFLGYRAYIRHSDNLRAIEEQKIKLQREELELKKQQLKRKDQ